MSSSAALPTHPTASPARPKKRRNRRPKACEACRARKVRCDYGEPCETCIVRRHPHLCVYADGPNNFRRSDVEEGIENDLSASTGNGLAPDDMQEGRASSSSIHPAASSDTLISLLDYIATHTTPVSEKDPQTGETLHFGPNSLPALFQCLLSMHPEGGSFLPSGRSIGSAFGLTNRTTLHPFASLWAATAKVTLGDILGSVPSTEHCMRYYRAYSQIVHPFVPYLLDPESFERRFVDVTQLVTYQGERSSVRSQAAADMPYEELGWYALLFAVLASGCQFADDASSERILTTRVFVACSFECLRLANFYVQPLPDSIQTTLILEYVIANDSNPGVAWTFLAISARQAESRGQHLLRKEHGETDVVHPLWRAVIHLDSILAFAFDRRNISFLPPGYDAAKSLGASGQVSFRDLSHAVCCLKLQWQTMRTDSYGLRLPVQEIRTYLARLEHVRKLAEHDRWSSVQARLEQLVLIIQLKHLDAEVHRAGAVHTNATSDQRVQWLHDMVAGFAQVVEAFLILKPLSPIAMSWDVWYCGVSAALVLAGLQVIQKNRDHEELLQSVTEALVPALLRAAMEDSPDNSASSCQTAMQIIEALIERSRVETEEAMNLTQE